MELHRAKRSGPVNSVGSHVVEQGLGERSGLEKSGPCCLGERAGQRLISTNCLLRQPQRPHGVDVSLSHLEKKSQAW